MNTNVKFHTKLPLGMVKGNHQRVWLKNGKELTIKFSPKHGHYVKFRGYNKVRVQPVNDLYEEIFEGKKTSSYQTEFSKTDLKYQNRRGAYVPSFKSRVAIISMSGYILRGANKGLHLRDLPLDTISWYVETQNLNKNEMYEIDAELKRRQNG